MERYLKIKLYFILFILLAFNEVLYRNKDYELHISLLRIIKRNFINPYVKTLIHKLNENGNK